MYCLIHYRKFQGYIILFMSKWKKRVEERLRTDILTSLSRWEFLNAYFGFAYKIKESRTTHPFAMAGQLFKGYFLMSRNFKRSKRNSDYRIVASWFSLVQTDHWNTFSFNLCHKSSNNRSFDIWQDKVCILAKLEPKLIAVFAVSLVRRDQECYYSPPPPSPSPMGCESIARLPPPLHRASLTIYPPGWREALNLSILLKNTTQWPSRFLNSDLSTQSRTR